VSSFITVCHSMSSLTVTVFRYNNVPLSSHLQNAVIQCLHLQVCHQVSSLVQLHITFPAYLPKIHCNITLPSPPWFLTPLPLRFLISTVHEFLTSHMCTTSAVLDVNTLTHRWPGFWTQRAALKTKISRDLSQYIIVGQTKREIQNGIINTLKYNI